MEFRAEKLQNAILIEDVDKRQELQVSKLPVASGSHPVSAGCPSPERSTSPCRTSYSPADRPDCLLYTSRCV